MRRLANTVSVALAVLVLASASAVRPTATRAEYSPMAGRVGIFTKTIDAKVAGAVLVDTTRANAKFYVESVAIESVSAAGIGTPVTLSIGTNASSYNNIVAAALRTNLTGALQVQYGTLLTTLPVIPASTAIYVNVTIPAVGTSQSLQIVVKGFYL